MTAPWRADGPKRAFGLCDPGRIAGRSPVGAACSRNSARRPRRLWLSLAAQIAPSLLPEGKQVAGSGQSTPASARPVRAGRRGLALQSRPRGAPAIVLRVRVRVRVAGATPAFPEGAHRGQTFLQACRHRARGRAAGYRLDGPGRPAGRGRRHIPAGLSLDDVVEARPSRLHPHAGRPGPGGSYPDRIHRCAGGGASQLSVPVGPGRSMGPSADRCGAKARP